MSDSLERSDKKSSGLVFCVLFSICFAALVAFDQVIKQIIVNTVKVSGTVTVIDKFFYLYYAENTGSAFSLFADKSWGIYFLSFVSLVLGAGIFVLMIIACMNRMKLIALAFCLLSAGAVGNLIDRFRLKYVIDFLRFDFGDYTFPIFNFADICAVLGTILVICIIVFGSRYFESFWNVLFAKRKIENAG
ncbi:MAG: signal peptidase II [Clostridiales bacterium]|jgi:signal peptidase II|nr:signal peptidase II [Clostridiales bacterium]